MQNKNIDAGVQMVGNKNEMVDAILSAQAQAQTPVGLGKIKVAYPVKDFVKTGKQETLPLQYKASINSNNYDAFVTGNSEDPKAIVVGGGVHGKYSTVSGSYVPATKKYSVAGSVPVSKNLIVNATTLQDGLGSIGATYVKGNLALNGNYTQKTDWAPESYRASINYRF